MFLPRYLGVAYREGHLHLAQDVREVRGAKDGLSRPTTFSQMTAFGWISRIALNICGNMFRRSSSPLATPPEAEGLTWRSASEDVDLLA
jgi:hypothetical protein